MYGSLDISVGGMVAQRTRLTTIATNIANSNTILDAQENPEAFRRRIPVFMEGDPSSRVALEGNRRFAGGGAGVHVHEIMLDDAPPRRVHDPSNPFAKPEGHPDAGYVYYPNIDTVTEQVNALDAQRAYEANVMVAEATKSMVAQALRLIG